MVNNISWQGYWTVLALLLAGYYLVIYLLYYRIDFIVKFHRKSSQAFDPISVRSNSSPPEEITEPLIHDCIDEMNAFFEQAKRNKCVKEEMIYSLQVILRKYPSLKNSEYKEALSNVIATQCEHICSIHLYEDEVRHVWLG